MATWISLVLNRIRKLGTSEITNQDIYRGAAAMLRKRGGRLNKDVRAKIRQILGHDLCRDRILRRVGRGRYRVLRRAF